MLKLILDLISDKPIDPNNYQQVLETVAIATNKIRLHQFDNEPLVTTINNFCNKTPSKTFIVSLSGGVDSMVVISIIHYLGYNVIAAHINYNNRPETILEEQFLDEWCKFNEIKLYKKVITNIKRATTKRSDYETITKMIRIEFYKEILKKENSDVIILGHHKDDIIENIFANVCRGRNILDLAVIQEHTVLSNINIARPMLDYYKQTILDFAKKYQIPYFKDTTPDWSVRGKYRNQIYPLIEDTFTKTIKNNLIYLSEQSSQWNQLINNEIIKPFMQDKPHTTFSIITPTYNRAEFLERVWESLNSQSAFISEWIVIDDGSTDKTNDVISKLQNISSIKIIYKYSLNRGMTSAINLGLKYITADYFNPFQLRS